MTRMCDVCGVRPAVGTIQRIRPGQPPETLNLCEVHLAEYGQTGSGFGGAGSGFGGLGMFDDFFSREETQVGAPDPPPVRAGASSRST
jgi:hypothetical protein